MRRQFAEPFKVQRRVAQKQDGSRALEEVFVTWTSRKADWESDSSRIVVVRLVEETVTAQLTLRGILSCVTTRHLRLIPELHRSEMQISSVRPYHHRIAAQCLKAVD